MAIHAGNISGSYTSTGSFGSVHTAGKVGIGTTAPADVLHVKGSTGDVGVLIETSYSNTGKWGLSASDNGGFYLLDKNASGTYPISVASGSHYVGIGTASPSVPFEANAAVEIVGKFKNTNTNASQFVYLLYNL